MEPLDPGCRQAGREGLSKKPQHDSACILLRLLLLACYGNFLKHKKKGLQTHVLQAFFNDGGS